ncbi:MAG: GNAT family N-acetyltransferase [Hyphomicrobiaceae bacterium]|nr:GNAT family N-acetyltransferase [Hyphomicrobiaceae bacterium]
MRATDAPRWRELWAAYNLFYEADVPETVTAHTLQRLLDPRAALVGRIAEKDGVVVGFSASVIHDATWDTRPVCYLEDLFVAEDARGHGLGRALIDDLVALAKTRGWGRLYWHTRTENAAARRLYDHYGAADDFVRYRLIF